MAVELSPGGSVLPDAPDNPALPACQRAAAQEALWRTDAKIEEPSMWFPPWVSWCGAVDRSELEEVIAILRSLGRFRKGML